MEGGRGIGVCGGGQGDRCMCGWGGRGIGACVEGDRCVCGGVGVRERERGGAVTTKESNDGLLLNRCVELYESMKFDYILCVFCVHAIE